MLGEGKNNYRLELFKVFVTSSDHGAEVKAYTCPGTTQGLPPRGAEWFAMAWLMPIALQRRVPWWTSAPN